MEPYLPQPSAPDVDDKPVPYGAGREGVGREGAARYALGAVATAIWPSTEKLLGEDVVAAIAKEAASADERGILSETTLGRLREAGYFGLPVPASLRGGGASLFECAAVQRRLGMADPALAIAVNMHL